MTSNDFFLNNSKKYDLIFVDGDHSSTQVKIDINNSWKILNKVGVFNFRRLYVVVLQRSKKNPSTSINSFIINHMSEISFLKIWHQVIIKKNI